MICHSYRTWRELLLQNNHRLVVIIWLVISILHLASIGEIFEITWYASTIKLVGIFILFGCDSHGQSSSFRSSQKKYVRRGCTKWMKRCHRVAKFSYVLCSRSLTSNISSMSRAAQLSIMCHSRLWYSVRSRLRCSVRPSRRHSFNIFTGLHVVFLYEWCVVLKEVCSRNFYYQLITLYCPCTGNNICLVLVDVFWNWIDLNVSFSLHIFS